MDTSKQFTLAHTPAPLFVGHEELLQSLRVKLLEKHVAVLSGMSGSGKTALAREYARRFGHTYTHVLWLDATTSASLMASILTQKQFVPLPEEIEHKGFAALNEIIEAWSGESDILLVLDNASFSPRISDEQSPVNAHILLIGHGREQISAENGLEIHPLAVHEYALLVMRRAGLLAPGEPLELARAEQRKRALELARELTGSPMALTLASGYLKANGDDLQDYLFAYRDCPERPDGSPDAETQVLEIVCDLTLARLSQSQPAALRVLQTCAFLSPGAIPRELLRQEKLQEILLPEESEQRVEQLDQALQTLLTYNVLDTQDEMNTFSIHPWLQRAVRQTLSQEQRNKFREQLLVACLQRAHSYEEEENPDKLSAATFSLAEHIYCIAVQSEETVPSLEQAAEVCTWAASRFGEQELVREAETLLSKALNIWERTVGYTHPSVAGTLFYLAIFNAQLRQYASAEIYAQRALTTTTRALGINHFKVLLCLNTMASIYQQQGKLNDAVLCYQKTLSIGERVGLQQHQFYLAARRELLKLRLAGSLT